ncbi:hypothetical protein MMC22_011796 [Lobaria immixta]|nr:hypothetical protein [Lobaria immixta]
MVNFKVSIFAGAYLVSTILLFVQSCFHPGNSGMAAEVFDPIQTALNNNRRRKLLKRHDRRIAINNVRVFDGRRLRAPQTVLIDGGVIGTCGKDAARAYWRCGRDAEQVDGHGGVLLPGFIDSHNHPATVDNLKQLSEYGITTALIMACHPKSLCQSLQRHQGLTDVFYVGTPAAAPNSSVAQIPGFPQDELVTSPAQAAQFVKNRVAEGASFVKIIAGNPGTPELNQTTLNALVDESHKRKKLTVCHAPRFLAVQMALEAKADQIHHVPLDIPLDTITASRYIQDKRISAPTLIVMKTIAQNAKSPAVSFASASASVTTLYKAGVPILVGTDAPGPFGGVDFGVSIHQEMELLAQAGMSNIDILRGATSLPAKYFGLRDRGVIKPGRRADLVLISGNPIANISATRNIQRTWIAGVEYVRK